MALQEMHIGIFLTEIYNAVKITELLYYPPVLRPTSSCIIYCLKHQGQLAYGSLTSS